MKDEMNIPKDFLPPNEFDRNQGNLEKNLKKICLSIKPKQSKVGGNFNKKPKRALTVYNIFYRDVRRRILSSRGFEDLIDAQHSQEGRNLKKRGRPRGPNYKRKSPHHIISLKELTSKVSKLWPKHKEEYLLKYGKIVEEDRKRYEIEKAQFWKHKQKIGANIDLSTNKSKGLIENEGSITSFSKAKDSKYFEERNNKKEDKPIFFSSKSSNMTSHINANPINYGYIDFSSSCNENHLGFINNCKSLERMNSTYIHEKDIKINSLRNLKNTNSVQSLGANINFHENSNFQNEISQKEARIEPIPYSCILRRVELPLPRSYFYFAQAFLSPCCPYDGNSCVDLLPYPPHLLSVAQLSTNNILKNFDEEEISLEMKSD